MMLDIKNLSCAYDTKIVLQDINLKVDEKEVVGIIGPNGSGKTTLLRAITGVLKPRQGAVFLDGQDICQLGFKALAQRIAVVSQGLPTGALSVEEFVLLGRLPHFNRFQFLETEKDLAIAKRSMSLTDSSRLKEQLIEEISGGERQLALIARALAQEPRLLLLDEPTAHLDITHQVGILDLIRKLNREFGLTVIMVLHDLNLASLYCDRLVLLYHGTIHKQGPPQEVLTYQTVEEVYKTVVVIKEDPISSRPYIFLVSEEEKARRI